MMPPGGLQNSMGWGDVTDKPMTVIGKWFVIICHRSVFGKEG